MVAAIEGGVRALVKAREMVAAFRVMIRRKGVADLGQWIDRSRDTLVASFVGGIVKDIAAVRAAIALPWSNGQTEGQITKLKLVSSDVRTRENRPASGAPHRRNLNLSCTKFASEPTFDAEREVKIRGRFTRVSAGSENPHFPSGPVMRRNGQPLRRNSSDGRLPVMPTSRFIVGLYRRARRKA
jgi:hypothetical protein